MVSIKMKSEKVFLSVSSSCLGRAMHGSFVLSISGRLRQPSLAPNVLYVIRKYAKIPWYCNNSRKCITIYG